MLCVGQVERRQAAQCLFNNPTTTMHDAAHAPLQAWPSMMVKPPVKQPPQRSKQNQNVQTNRHHPLTSGRLSKKVSSSIVLRPRDGSIGRTMLDRPPLASSSTAAPAACCALPSALAAEVPEAPRAVTVVVVPLNL